MGTATNQIATFADLGALSGLGLTSKQCVTKANLPDGFETSSTLAYSNRCQKYSEISYTGSSSGGGSTSSSSATALGLWEDEEVA